MRLDDDLRHPSLKERGARGEAPWPHEACATGAQRMAHAVQARRWLLWPFPFIAFLSSSCVGRAVLVAGVVQPNHLMV